jgi:predicted AAA+ superfamily ATPase
MIQRKQYQLLISRLQEPRKCIQVIQGPRQVGKSTMVKQVLKDISIPWLHFSTDNVPTS